MQTATTERQLALRITTNRLYQLDQDIKRLEKEKKRLRDDFFDLANEELVSERMMDRQLIEIPKGAEILPHIESNYPGWRLVQEIEGSRFVQIEENPAFLKFSYVNPDNDMVFSRQVAQVGVEFDAAGFWAKHASYADQCVSQEIVYVLNEDAAQDLVESIPDSVRAFQEFTSKGRLQPKLAAPRKATEDDLA